MVNRRIEILGKRISDYSKKQKPYQATKTSCGDICKGLRTFFEDFCKISAVLSIIVVPSHSKIEEMIVNKLKIDEKF